MKRNSLPVSRLRLSTLALFAAVVLTPSMAHGQSDEARVKAAFLYNFAKYVVWPSSAFESSNSPIVIGIVGNDAISGPLESIVEGKTASGRRLVVRYLKWTDDLSECQELFVPAEEMSGVSHLDALRSKPVLIVGESPGFAKKRGAINFTLEGNRVRFEINEGNATHGGLSISSKLLSLGKAPA